MSKQPPTKKPGQATGRRKINGAVLDVAGAAEYLGVTDKQVRARVERGLLPFRRWGGRVVFLKDELMDYFAALDGTDLLIHCHR